MGKRFKNSEEAIKALKKQGWKLERTTKHAKLSHPLFIGKLPVPKKHSYLSDKVEAVIIKAIEEVDEAIRREGEENT